MGPALLLRVTIIFGALLLSVALALQFLPAETTPSVDQNVSEVVAEAKSPENTATVAAIPVAGAEAACLSHEAFEAHPVVRAERERVASLLRGPARLESFLGLDEKAVRSVADQGDATAMAVLGAIKIVQANGQPAEYAVPYLRATPRSHGPSVRAFISPEGKEQMEVAQAWFYKSAVHGRLASLVRYGDLYRYTASGSLMEPDLPVNIGWISRDEYYALTEEERRALHPAFVYTRLVYDIAPDLATGPIMQANIARLPTSARQVALRLVLMNEYKERVAEEGLTIMKVPPADDALYDVFARRCD